MKLFSFLTLLTVTVASYSFAADEDVIKLQPNSPVVYHAKMKMTAQQKTDSGLKEIGKGTMQFSAIVNVNADKKPYEFLATPKFLSVDINMGGLTVSYDTKLAMETNSIAQEKALLQTVLDHTFRIPLTTDPNVGDANDFYVIKIFNNPDGKFGSENELQEITKAIDTGFSYKVGHKEEVDLGVNGMWEKGHILRTVTQVDENKVVMTEEMTLESTTFANGENPEDGGYQIKGSGKFEKSIQRSNWLLMSGEGSMNFQIAELEGPNGKQSLSDGDLIINIDFSTTSNLPDSDSKLITYPIAQTR